MKAKSLPRIFVIALLALHTVEARDFSPETPGSEGERAFRELGAFYENGETEPGYAGALGDLAGADAAKREIGGRFLLALFRQCFADESNGRAVWRRQPYWGGGSESAARNFRKKFAVEFGEKARGEAALDAVLWLIETEKMPEGQAAAAKVLPRIESPRMEKLLADLLAQPHPNAALAVAAVEEAGRRKLAALMPRVRELRGHYRDAVRDAARKAAPDGAPEFKPAEAFSPWLLAQLAPIREMLPLSAPENAPWFDFQSKQYTGTRKETRWVTHDTGWVAAERKHEFDVLNYHGSFVKVWKENTRRVPREPADVAKEIAALQKSKDDGRERLSERGGLTAQFEGGRISTPAGVVAALCVARGELAAAAEVLFPNINAMPDDRWLTGVLRDRLGNASHRRMLEAFSYERDYATAITLADHLSKPVFDGYQYQQRAKELAAQLRKRSDDFKAFKLPSADEWQKLKERSSREEQITYLTERLRLLNCIQHGQPGDVDYGDPQFPDIDTDPEDPKAKRVINPFMELRKMELTVAELPALVPSLADENYLPTFSYWRDFHPSRSLHRVNWLVAEIVNDTAKRELAELEKFTSLEEAGRKQHLDAILAWCRANAGKTRADLLLATLATVANWRDVELAADEALRGKVPGAGAVLIERMKDFPDEFATIAKLIYASGVRAAIEPAREWAKSDDKDVRFWGALVLMRDGDREKNEGFAELTALIDQDDGSDFHPRAIPVLLARKDEASLTLALGILKKRKLSDYDAVLHRLAMTGRKEVLDFLLAGLDDKTVMSTASKGKLKWTYVRGDGIAGSIAGWRKDKWEYDRNATDKARAAKRGELKRWLPKAFALIRDGKGAPFHTPGPDSGAPWLVDAP